MKKCKGSIAYGEYRAGYQEDGGGGRPLAFAGGGWGSQFAVDTVDVGKDPSGSGARCSNRSKSPEFEFASACVESLRGG